MAITLAGIGTALNIGSQAMGFLDNLFGSFSGSNASSGLNRDDTKWMYDQQSTQWRANTTWYNRNGYSLLREGLEKAGYNPLMALGREPLDGATVSGSAVTSSEKSRAIDLPQSIRQALSVVENTKADTALKFAQTEENISRSQLENAQTVLQTKEIPFRDKQLALAVIQQNLQNDLIKSQMSNVNADTTLKRMSSNLTSSEIKRINHEIDILRNQKIISDKEAQWLKKNPGQAQWTYGIGKWTGAIGNIFGGNAGINYGVHSK